MKLENEANRIVSQCENDYLCQLQKSTDREAKRAEKCGCNDCRRVFRRKQTEYSEEWYRTQTEGVDEEEDWIAWMARKKMGWEED